MKITRAKFKNFIGFKKGLNKTEVEFKFTANDKNIIILVGGNGKGKSTLMYNLHPAAHPADPKRKKLITPNTEGRKEIDIDMDGVLYEIIHLYPIKGNTKSFISKTVDGVKEELNPNGGVTTFNDIVELELGFTPDFFRVGRIASDSNNFIDMIASDRKKFISKFLPDIDCYLNANDIVSEKIKYVKKELTLISDMITKLGSKDDLQDRFEKKNVFIDSTKKTITELNAEFNKMQGFMDHIDVTGELKSGNPASKELTTVSSEIEKIQNDIMALKTKYTALASFDLTLTTERLAANQQEMEGFASRISELNILLASNKEKINSFNVTIMNKQDSLRAFTNSGKTRMELEQILRDVTEKHDKYASAISSKTIDEIEKITSFEYVHIDAARVKATNVYDNIINIKSNYDPTIIRLAVDALSEPNMTPDKINARADKYLEGIVSQREETLKKLSFVEKRYERYQESVKHKCPSGNNCPHQSAASKFADYGKEVTIFRDELNKIDTLAEAAKDNSDLLQKVKEIATLIYRLYDGIKLNKIMTLTKLRKYVPSLKDFASVIMLSNAEIQDVFSFIGIIAFVEAKENIDEYTSKMASIQESIDTVIRNSDVIEKINSEIAQVNVQKEELTNVISEYEQELAQLTASSNGYKVKVDILNNLRELFEAEDKLEPRRKDLLEKYTDYELKLRTYREYSEKQDLIMRQLRTLNPQLEQNSKELDDLKGSISRFDEYTTRFGAINGQLEKLQLVKNAVDPVKGIPVHLIQEYLKNISGLSNDLLDIAYGGQFRIDNFVLSEKEFQVPVIKNGDKCDDIIEASQGEIALTKIALSFAIFIHTIKKYNILGLDEADSALDTNNRSMFLEILKKQITELKLEQVFVITHNDEFYSSEASLILFPEHDVNVADESFMLNKTIVTDLSLV